MTDNIKTFVLLNTAALGTILLALIPALHAGGKAAQIVAPIALTAFGFANMVACIVWVILKIEASGKTKK